MVLRRFDSAGRPAERCDERLRGGSPIALRSALTDDGRTTMVSEPDADDGSSTDDRTRSQPADEAAAVSGGSTGSPNRDGVADGSQPSTARTDGDGHPVSVTETEAGDDPEYDDSVDAFIEDVRERLTGLVSGASKGVLLAATGMGLAIAGMTAWVFSNLFWLAFPAAVIGGGISWRYLMQQRNGWIVGGTGLYVLAAEAFVLPIMFYLPTIFRTSSAETAEGAGMFIGSILGIFIWQFVMVIIAVIFGAVGFGLRRHGRSEAETEAADV